MRSAHPPWPTRPRRPHLRRTPLPSTVSSHISIQDFLDRPFQHGEILREQAEPVVALLAGPAECLTRERGHTRMSRTTPELVRVAHIQRDQRGPPGETRHRPAHVDLLAPFLRVGPDVVQRLVRQLDVLVHARGSFPFAGTPLRHTGRSLW